MGVKDKKGKKSSSGQSPEQQILTYMVSKNRPYSAIDIFNNLHGEIGKTQVVKSLSQLAKDGQIKEKEYGKAKIYAPLQEGLKKASEEELKEMDDQIQTLKDEIKSSKGILDEKNRTLSGICARLSLEEIAEKSSFYEDSISKLEEKLNALKSGSTVLLTKSEISKLTENVEASEKVWRKT